MKVKLSGFVALIVIFGIFGVMVWAFFEGNRVDTEVLTLGEECVCEIIEYSNRGSKARVTFKDGSERVMGISNDDRRLYSGDKYYCKYLKAYPKNLMLLYDKEYPGE